MHHQTFDQGGKNLNGPNLDEQNAETFYWRGIGGGAKTEWTLFLMFSSFLKVNLII